MKYHPGNRIEAYGEFKMRNQNRNPSERIKRLLEEIKAKDHWISIAEGILQDAEREFPPIPDSNASHWEIGFREARGGQIGFIEHRESQRRSRIRRSDPEIELNRVRGRQTFGSLSLEQMAEIEAEIEAEASNREPTKEELELNQKAPEDPSKLIG